MELLYQQYISDVKKGNIVVCKKIKQAIKRHLQDLKKSKKEDFPYFFNETEARKIISFASNCRGNEGQFFNRPLELDGWQQFLLVSMFGWRRKDNGLRRFRRCYCQVGKKSGKSTLMAIVTLYAMLEENGAEVYIASGKKDQSKFVFKYAAGMVQKSPSLQEIFTVYKDHIDSNFKGNKGHFEHLSYENKGKADGKNASCLIVDEYHVFENADFIKDLETGMQMRQQPLTFIITTAGGNKSGPCFEYYKLVSEILGEQIENDRLFGLIYEFDAEEEWTDEEMWIKPLPSIGKIGNIEEIRDQVKQAQLMTSERYSLMTKTFNMWMDIQDVWIDSTKWKKCQTTFRIEELAGADCFIGLDLSQVSDLTAITAYFKPTEDYKKYRALHWCFIPEESIAKKRQTENINYTKWIEDGYVIPTPGAHVDYSYVVDKLLEIGKTYNIKKLYCDPYNVGGIDEQLKREGFELEAVQQGLMHFSPITKLWEISVYKGEIADPNPIMAWCLSNAVIKSDTNNNYKPLKKEPDRKIDLVITSIMAKFGCDTSSDEPEYYSDEDFLF